MSKYSDNMNNSVGKLQYFLEVRKRCVTDEKSVVQNKSFRGILGYHRSGIEAMQKETKPTTGVTMTFNKASNLPVLLLRLRV